MARITAFGQAQLKMTAHDWTGNMLNFRKMEHNLREEIQKEFEEIAYGIQIDVDHHTPRDTKFLVDHLKTKFSDTKQVFEVGWWAEDFLNTSDPRNPRKRWYAHYVNQGTSKMAPRHMLEKGYAKGTTKVKPEMMAAINRVIAKHSI